MRSRRTMWSGMGWGMLGLLTVTPVAWAATATAVVTISATVPAVSSFAVQKGTNSACPTPGAVSFTKLDSADVTGGSSDFIYAPLRSVQNANCYELAIDSNLGSNTISATVTGTAGTLPLSGLLSTFWGGCFKSDGTNAGQASTTWETTQGFTRTYLGGLTGVCSVNHRLTVKGLQPGSYTGTVTWTLTAI